MTDLERLAERVEALTGPDRDVDAEIKEAVGAAWDYAADWGSRDNCKPVAMAYTASIDAAMTLVPANAASWATYSQSGDLSARGVVNVDHRKQFGCDAATPALALTAAALRARALAAKSREVG